MFPLKRPDQESLERIMLVDPRWNPLWQRPNGNSITSHSSHLTGTAPAVSLDTHLRIPARRFNQRQHLYPSRHPRSRTARSGILSRSMTLAGIPPTSDPKPIHLDSKSALLHLIHCHHLVLLRQGYHFLLRGPLNSSLAIYPTPLKVLLLRDLVPSPATLPLLPCHRSQTAHRFTQHHPDPALPDIFRFLSLSFVY